jgi:glycosyltransferase involved in cell wall biosynthesis
MASISVVIPSLNDGAMLANCLTALAAQSRPADEIIVVDNGSTDDTVDVARAAGARVVDQPLRGIFPATAAGFDAAKGDIIARLDADSVPGPDWLERVQATFSANPGLAALTGPGDFYGSNRLIHWIGETMYIGGYFWYMTPLFGHPPLFGSNMALSSTAWRRLRLTVHSSLGDIHDDFDLTFHIEPDMQVIYDHTLRVGISARPFASWKGLGRRLVWSYTTSRLNTREQSMFKRRAIRRAWAAQQIADRESAARA